MMRHCTYIADSLMTKKTRLRFTLRRFWGNSPQTITQPPESANAVLKSTRMKLDAFVLLVTYNYSVIQCCLPNTPQKKNAEVRHRPAGLQRWCFRRQSCPRLQSPVPGTASSSSSSTARPDPPSHGSHPQLCTYGDARVRGRVKLHVHKKFLGKTIYPY